MFKDYLKINQTVQARKKYLRTVKKLDPHIADDIGVPEEDFVCDLPTEEEWINAELAGRFAGGWGLSSGWCCSQRG